MKVYVVVIASDRAYSSHHAGHHLGELGGFLGFLGLLGFLVGMFAFVSALGSNFVDRLVSLLGDTLDESSSSSLAHLFAELLLDEDSCVLDGGSSGHLSLVEGILLRFASGDGFLGDLVSDLTSDSLELLEGLRFSVFSSNVDSHSGGSSGGTFDVLDDMSSGLFAEFLDKVGLHLLHSLLDSFTSSLSGLSLGVLDSLGSLLVSGLLDGFLSCFLGNSLHLSDDLVNNLCLGFLRLFGNMAYSLSGGDTTGNLDVLDSDHLAALSNEDGLLSAEGSAVGTSNLSLDLLEVGGTEVASGVSENSSHGIGRGVEGSIGLSGLASKGECVASNSDLGPLDVLPGLTAHSEDGCKSVFVCACLFGVRFFGMRMSTCMASMGST